MSSSGSPQAESRKSHFSSGAGSIAVTTRKVSNLAHTVGMKLLRKSRATRAEPEVRGPQRRHLPAQAGTFSDRRDADALARLESESAEHVIEAGLWRYHRLLPAVQDSKRYLRFNSLLLFFLYYTSFWLPLRVAFFPRLDTLGWQLVDGVDIFIDLCFWLDIALTTRTAFYDHQNELITDWRLIVKRYLRFWFWVDTLSNFPWDSVTGLIQFKIVRLARSFRLFKVKSQATAQSVSLRLLVIIGLILFLCHWIACLWWAVGSSITNLSAEFGHSWLFRHRADDICPALPSTPEHMAAAEQALQMVKANLTQGGNELSEEQETVLRHNWRYAWCEEELGMGDAGPHGDGVGQLSHDFKLYLGNVTRLYEAKGAQQLYDIELFLQQYLSSLYWSLTMLMKTAYVGPDTVQEKGLACLLVLLGAIVFAMIMGAVVGVIKAVEAHNASLRGLLEQNELFAKTRNLPTPLARTLLRFVDTQWLKVAGLDTNDVLGSGRDFSMRLPTRFHDEILLSVHAELIDLSPLLSRARDCPGAGALPPLLRLLQPMVVLQKQMLMADTWPCNEIYILQKGTLQAELSLQVRVNIEHSAGAQHARRGGGDLMGHAGACGETAAQTPAELAAAVAAAAEQPTYRGGAGVGAEASAVPGVGRGVRSTGAGPSGRATAMGAITEDPLAGCANLKGLAALGGVGAAAEASAMPRPTGGGHHRGSCDPCGGAGGGRQATRSNTRKRNWKANLQSRQILEMPGSMVGISDPLGGRAGVSPHIVTALKQCEVFVLHRGPLKAILSLLPFEDSHALCSVVQGSFNHLCQQLKAKELISDTVDKRKEEHDRLVDDEKLHSAGLAHASSIRELDDKLDELEMRVEQAGTTAANLRASCAPLLAAQKLLTPWAVSRGVDLAQAVPAHPGVGAGQPSERGVCTDRRMAGQARERKPSESAALGWAPSVVGDGRKSGDMGMAERRRAGGILFDGGDAGPSGAGAVSAGFDSNRSDGGQAAARRRGAPQFSELSSIDESRKSRASNFAARQSAAANARRTIIHNDDDDDGPAGYKFMAPV